MTIFDVIPIRVIDVLEITVVAYILYKLYLLMRGTIGVQIFLGVMGLLLIQVLVTWANMTMLGALFSLVSEVAVLAVIILFQPELRRLLLLLGRNPLIRRFVSTPEHDEMIDEVTAAVEEMSKHHIGALIVFERTTGLRSYIETGTQLQARITRDLIITLFYEKNPLHDGAVIVQNRRLQAARCILPVSTSMKLSPTLGLRHRAAVGLTEQTDAFVIVVSEETGTISVAKNGDLISNLTVSELRTHLTDALSAPTPAPSELPAAEDA